MTEPSAAHLFLSDEFLQIIDHVDELTIVEPSPKPRSQRLGDKRPRYAHLSPDTALSFPNASFDLVFCLSVLHHIPQVSARIRKLVRVLSLGGHMFVLQPVVSLGDWTGPRKVGLTKRERDLPHSLLRSMLADEALVVEYEIPSSFPITWRLPRGYDSVWWLRVDPLLSKATTWNYRYHPMSVFQKIRPTDSYCVATRPRSSTLFAAS